VSPPPLTTHTSTPSIQRGVSLWRGDKSAQIRGGINSAPTGYGARQDDQWRELHSCRPCRWRKTAARRNRSCGSAPLRRAYHEAFFPISRWFSCENPRWKRDRELDSMESLSSKNAGTRLVVGFHKRPASASGKTSHQFGRAKHFGRNSDGFRPTPFNCRVASILDSSGAADVSLQGLAGLSAAYTLFEHGSCSTRNLRTYRSTSFDCLLTVERLGSNSFKSRR
jgi:hypothetical protein